MFVRSLIRMTTSITSQDAVKYICGQATKATFSSTSTHSSCFRYTHAITRELPKSFAEQAIKMDSSQEISLSRAVQEWNNYLDVLKQCGLQVITLPADENYPDCVFVEDVAVVIGNKACLTRPGHPSRRGEVEPVRKCLQTLGFEIQELDDPSAELDGGDVLFTGQEIFVGQSARSNKAGADCLQRAFPEFRVTPISVDDALHLKSVATLVQDGIILVGSSKTAQHTIKNPLNYTDRDFDHGDNRGKPSSDGNSPGSPDRGKGQYQIVQLAEDKSANAMFLNGHAIIKTEKELGDDFKKVTSAITVPWTAVELSELYKVDGCLTCCSILVSVPAECD